MMPGETERNIPVATILAVLLAVAGGVAYVGGTWHAFVAEGLGAGLASAFLVLPAWYYFVKMLTS